MDPFDQARTNMSLEI